MKIYYEKDTGFILVNTGEREGETVYRKTVEQDIASYTALSERNRDSFDVLELEYGQYAQDFAESNGYRVNPETKELEFSYPDPSEPEAPPVYEKPLSEQIAEVKAQNEALGLTVDSILTDVIPNLLG